MNVTRPSGAVLKYGRLCPLAEEGVDEGSDIEGVPWEHSDLFFDKGLSCSFMESGVRIDGG